MKYKPLTHAQHRELAKKVRAVQELINEIAITCSKHYPKNSKVQKAVWAIDGLTPGSALNKLKCRLDSEYHKVTTDKQFNDAGHVYYNDCGKWAPSEDGFSDAERLRLIKHRLVELYSKRLKSATTAVDDLSAAMISEGLIVLKELSVVSTLFDDVPIEVYSTTGTPN